MQANAVQDDLYVVERIIGKKVVDSKIYYLVKWQGYEECDSTWEKLSHLKYVRDLVEQFEKNNSTEPNKSSSSISEDTSQSDIVCSYEATIDNKEPIQKSMTQVLLEEDQDEVQEVQEVPSPGYVSCRNEQQKKQAEVVKSGEKDDRLRFLTGSAKKLEKERKKLRDEKMKCLAKERELRRMQKKETKKYKQLRKEESKKSTDSQSLKRSQKEKAQESTDKNEKETTLNQSSTLKGEEDESSIFEPVDLKIRLIVAEDDSDIRDYVAVYPNGTSKVFNTCQMFYAHPVEFVTYLEKRTSKAKK